MKTLTNPADSTDQNTTRSRYRKTADSYLPSDAFLAQPAALNLAGDEPGTGLDDSRQPFRWGGTLLGVGIAAVLVDASLTSPFIQCNRRLKVNSAMPDG
jgi:hypothetical protein